MKETEIIEEEVKTRVAKRVPPGDVWTPINGPNITLESLTDMLEYIYQQNGNTQFYMDAREGFVYTVSTTKVEKPVEPEKKYSLYGE